VLRRKELWKKMASNLLAFAKSVETALEETDPVLLASAVVCGISLFVTLRLTLWQRKLAKMTMPKVRNGLPIIGQVINMLKTSPWDVMTDWANTYGSLYQFNIFGKTCVTVSDPTLIKEILHTKMSKFAKDTEFTYRPFISLLGTGLVTSEGKLWRKQRTLVSSAFRIEILHEIPQLAKEATDRLSVKLEKIRGTGQSIEIAEEFRHLTLQVICEAILSLSPNESDATLATMYMPIVEEGHRRVWYPFREYLPTPGWFKYFHDVRRINKYITSLIKKRWELRLQEETTGSKRKFDILDKVMGSIDKSSWGPKMIKQLRDEIKTFILAGHETSASMLTWALYELIEHPEQMKRIQGEAKSVFGPVNAPSSSLPQHDDLTNLVYSECCLKEALRKYSVVPTVVRKCTEDITIDGEYFPKGITVMLGLQAVHHREDIWPEPQKYVPERFLKAPRPYTFLPFIDGPRQCLGQYLSLLESKVVLSILVQRFTFQLANSKEASQKHPWMIPIIPKYGTEVIVN